MVSILPIYVRRRAISSFQAYCRDGDKVLFTGPDIADVFAVMWESLGFGDCVVELIGLELATLGSSETSISPRNKCSVGQTAVSFLRLDFFCKESVSAGDGMTLAGK
jgi:hypothetical protein